MFGKKKDTPKVADAVNAAVNYEITIADLARRSAKRAWMVASVSLAMSLILAGGYFFMLPLKERVPFLVMADAYTGNATIARLQEDFSTKSVTTSEAINRSNVAHFVMMREGYDYAMLGLRDWRAVNSMSSPEVALEYRRLYDKSNLEGPLALYGTKASIRIKILSIVFVGQRTAQSPPRGATVRFQRVLYEKASGQVRPLDSKLATLEFSYDKDLKFEEQDRIENPLGFQVTSYRVDSDLAASPPLEQPAPAAAPLAAPAQAAPAGAAAPVPGGTTAPAIPPDPTAPAAAATPPASVSTPMAPASVPPPAPQIQQPAPAAAPAITTTGGTPR